MGMQHAKGRCLSSVFNRKRVAFELIDPNKIPQLLLLNFLDFIKRKKKIKF